ncbi:MAG: tyrosine protein phosphatase [Dehalococcoidia bacterium]
MDWIREPRLAVVSRPSPTDIERELRELRIAGFATRVSLLSPAESVELELTGEPQAAVAAGLNFVSHPIPDFSVPGTGFVERLFELHERYRSGESLAAHCRGGVGRSPLTIAGLLVLDGADPDDAWSRVSAARGVAVPDTAEQRQWIKTLSARS